MDAGDWIFVGMTLFGLLALIRSFGAWYTGLWLTDRRRTIREKLAVARTTLRCALRARYRYFAYVLSFSLLAGAACMALYSKTAYGWFFPAWAAMGGAGLWFHFSTPPVVLLLAASKALDPELASMDAAELLAAVHRGADPHRVVYLLNPEATGVGMLSHYAMDNLRTSSDADWVEVVHALAEFVPIIVVDTRFSTYEVSQEVEHLCTRGMLNKTLFVWDPVRGAELPRAQDLQGAHWVNLPDLAECLAREIERLKWRAAEHLF